jgi:hypothetical protein
VIDPSSRKRWAEVSQCVGVQWRMPSTTNSLESIHGHLNEATPRRNDFWASLKRLADHIDNGIKRWPEAVRHNFNHACRVSIDRISKIGEVESQDQIRTFRSTSLDCPCGETVYLSGMYNCPLPCCHMIHSRATRLKMSTSPVLRTDGWGRSDGLTVTIEELVRVTGSLTKSRVKSLAKMATGAIHHGSRTRQTKGEVGQWVNIHWPTGPPNSYMLGTPDTVLSLILLGIDYFSRTPVIHRR